MNIARRKNSSSGMILILTLWVLAILSLLLLTLFSATNLNTQLADNAKLEADSEAIGRGAVYAVLKELIEQHIKADKKKKTQSDAGKEAPYFVAGNELGFYVVEPERWKVTKYGEDSGFSSQNWLSKNYAVCYVTAEDAKAAASGLKKENLEKIPGMTGSLANSITELLKKKENKLSCLEELLCLKDVQGDIYDGDGGEIAGLKNCLTVFSQGELYINRATAPAIAAALNIDISKAASIAEAVKSKHYFYDIGAVGSAAGVGPDAMKGSISLTCQTYRIKTCVVSGGQPRILEAVAVIEKGNSFSIAYMGSN